MEIQLDKNTLPANDQQVRFREVGSADWQEGIFIEEDSAFMHGHEAGSTINAFDVEEWEPLDVELSEGEKLRRHREQQGHTQAQYANIVGLSRDATISDWEKGKKPVPGFMHYIIKLEKEVKSLKKGRCKNNFKIFYTIACILIYYM